MNFIKGEINVDVEPLVAELKANPQLWNEYPERKIAIGSPHADMTDIWLRFRPKHELTTPESYAESFIPAWYPSRKALPSAEKISLDMVAAFRAVQLGGVLITKIPPQGKILPHHDKGRWHSEFFNTKIYIPLASNDNCINTCEDESVNMKKGEVWTFDNLKVHSVENNGDTDRITLIVSMRCENGM